jgi:hypothetical protein
MLSRRTVLIVGAGAGVDLNMPLGEALARRVADKLDIRFGMSRELKSGNEEIANTLRHIAKKEQVDFNQYRSAGCTVSSGVPYTRSIDNYIHTHRDNQLIKTCAKLAIAHSILEAEHNSHVYVDPSRGTLKYRDEERAHKSWLHGLMQILQDGVIASENLEDYFKSLDVINFNYDRCFEHYVLVSIRNVFHKKEAEAAELINAHLRIRHPYGTIGKLPWQGGGDGLAFGEFKPGENDLVRMSQGIRTYNEEVEEGAELEAARAAIKTAQRVVFLGFHFHKQNVDLITPADDWILTERPEIYFTSVARSEADIGMIKRRITSLMYGKGHISEERNLDCQRLFRDYGAALAD